jgi:hypothetical protein
MSSLRETAAKAKLHPRSGVSLRTMQDFAVKVARVLLSGSQQIGSQPLGRQNIGALLAFLDACNSGEWRAADPRIEEILIFGSTARGVANPGDLDLILLDTGFYSRHFSRSRDLRRSWYEKLHGNLSRLLYHWFNLRDNRERLEILHGPSVDLHILPVAMLNDPKLHERLALSHDDPKFFDNAFSTIQRFDEAMGIFVPTSLEFLRKKHRGNRTPIEARA